MEGSSEKVLLYLHGVGDKDDLWYRVEFEFTKEKIGILQVGQKKKIRLPIKKISPVAIVDHEDCGIGGSWEVIGDDIYWFGAVRCESGRIVPLNKLRKRNMNDPRSYLWETVSNSMKIPRTSAFLSAVGKNQLCVVGGTQHFPRGSDDEAGWGKCGEVYDIENQTWTFIDAEYKDVCSYNTFHQACLVQQDGDEDDDVVRKKIMFYSLDDGSTLVLDLPSGSTKIIKYPDFDVWKRGFWGQGGGFVLSDLGPLKDVSYNMPAVFINNTFYWFTHMRLIGYDTKHQIWLRSPLLSNHLPQIFRHICQYAVLIGLGVGKLLLITPQDEGELTIAPLSVEADLKTHSLTVTVSFLQPLLVDDHSFLPFDGKAMLKVEESD